MKTRDHDPVTPPPLIRALREARGWSQERLADLLREHDPARYEKISAPVVSRWESGRREMRWDDIVAVSVILGVHPGLLFPEETMKNNTGLIEAQRRAARIVLGLNAQDLDIWLALGERLLDAENQGNAPEGGRRAHDPVIRAVRAG